MRVLKVEINGSPIPPPPEVTYKISDITTDDRRLVTIHHKNIVVAQHYLRPSELMEVGCMFLRMAPDAVPGEDD